MLESISAGAELTDTNEDTALTVVSVHDDGSLSLRVWVDQRHGQEYYDIREDATDVETALNDGTFKIDE